MRRHGGGVIVNIASTSGVGGTAMYAPYVASKWAVRGLTKTAALELGRDHIRVNAINPGVIATPFITEPAAGSDTPISDFHSAEPFAIPRLGELADITKALLFLTSDEASFATGSEFVIDGGLLLGPALKHEAVRPACTTWHSRKQRLGGGLGRVRVSTLVGVAVRIGPDAVRESGWLLRGEARRMTQLV